MTRSTSKTTKALLNLIKAAFSDWNRSEVIDVEDAYQLPNKKIKVELKEYSFELYLLPYRKSLQI